MKSVTLHDKTFVPYISNAELMAAIDKVAEKIIENHKNDTEPPILLCVLNGSVMFVSELMKRIELPLELMSIKVASYSGTSSVGPVKEVQGLTGSVKGRNVIVCEDIVDTGKTLAYLSETLHERGAAKVEMCTMLTKPDVYKGNIPLDYVGLEIENRFIVGFGLDYDQLGRNINEIYILKQ